MAFALPVWLAVQEELLESDEEGGGALSCFDEFDDEALQETFHLTKPCLHFIRDAVLVRMKKCTLKKFALSLDVMLPLALNYYAHGSISGDTLQRTRRFETDCPAIISAVSGVIAGMSDQFISFPLLQGARASVASKTEKICGIPNVLGVLAPAHFEVQVSLKEKDAFKSFVSASGFPSVVSQLICDLDGNLLSVEKCCVGSTSEQEMWESSFKGRELEKELHGPYWVIGKSVSKHVLTPVQDPSNEKDIRYNEAHAKLYSVMQTTLGHIKTRFRCLVNLGFAQKGSLDKKSNIIKACCVLHNIAKKFSVPLPPSVVKTEHGQPDMEYTKHIQGDDSAGPPYSGAGMQDKAKVWLVCRSSSAVSKGKRGVWIQLMVYLQ
uniref:DDE Tnp4 domain-containing protein n=1 Tax=Takifugu rubripes TaxID=31033 RepID=A0A674NI27_TAKRU